MSALSEICPIDFGRTASTARSTSTTRHPWPGWPQWMSAQIFDEERFILVVASADYARRWSMAEQRGVGLGAKYEGKLIRQVLYSAEGLNGRVVPVLMSSSDSSHIPAELQDTTRYDISTDVGYDHLLRRLTRHPAAAPPAVGEPAALLDQQPAHLAAAFFVLQRVAAPLPVDALGEAARTTPAALREAVESEKLAPFLVWREGDLLSTTYYRPVYPLPSAPSELLSPCAERPVGLCGQPRNPRGHSRTDQKRACAGRRRWRATGHCCPSVWDHAEGPEASW